MNQPKTKTYDYLFRVFKGFYLEKNVSRAINKLFTSNNQKDFLDVNAYLADISIKPFDPTIRRFCLTCDIRTDSYSKAITDIEKSRYFKYGYVSRINPNCSVLIFDVPMAMKDSWDKFLESKYSKIYSQQSKILKDRGVRSEYVCYSGDMDYLPAYYILQKDEEYFINKILPLVDNLSDEEISEIRKKEYASKVDIKNETYGNGKQS